VLRKMIGFGLLTETVHPSLKQVVKENRKKTD